MDYSIIIIFSLVILYFASQIHWTYFSRASKLNDQHLMQNFLDLKMKQSNKKYYPRMKIDKEF